VNVTQQAKARVHVLCFVYTASSYFSNYLGWRCWCRNEGDRNKYSPSTFWYVAVFVMFLCVTVKAGLDYREALRSCGKIFVYSIVGLAPRTYLNFLRLHFVYFLQFRSWSDKIVDFLQLRLCFFAAGLSLRPEMVCPGCGGKTWRVPQICESKRCLLVYDR